MAYVSAPPYDANVISNHDFILSDRLFLTFDMCTNRYRYSLIGPLPPPDATAILVYDRHRNAWLDPLIIYKCVGVPFQILPFHEPLKFHLLCRLDSTVQMVTCAISDNMQSVRVTEAESLFTIDTIMDYYAVDDLKVYFVSGHPLLASHTTYDELILHKVHDGMVVETKHMFANRISYVHYTNRKLQFLHAPDYDHWILSTFNIDSSELTEAEGLDLGTDECVNFFFGKGKLFRYSTYDKEIYIYELAAPYAIREICLPLRALEINFMVHMLDGQIWAHCAHECVYCGRVKGIVSLWYEPPSLYDIALRAIHENLTVTAKRALRKSEDPPLFNYELLVDFVLSYKQDDDLPGYSSEDESPRWCDCEKYHSDDDSDSDGYVGNYAFGAGFDRYLDIIPYMYQAGSY